MSDVINKNVLDRAIVELMSALLDENKDLVTAPHRIEVFSEHGELEDADVATITVRVQKPHSNKKSSIFGEMEEIQQRLQDGTAKWHTFDQVFGENN